MRALMTDMELRKLIAALDPRQKDDVEDDMISTEEMAVYACAYLFANPPKKEFNQLNVLRKQMAHFFNHGDFRTADAMGQ